MERGNKLLLVILVAGAAAIGITIYRFRAQATSSARSNADLLAPLDGGELDVTIVPGVLDIPAVPDIPGAPAQSSPLDVVSMWLGDAWDAVKKSLQPRGMRNNNPGNIRTLPPNKAWRGQVADDGGGYGVYDTMALGVRAAAHQLLAYEARGLTTLRQIISTWAPSSENNTAAYVAAVGRAMSLAADEHFSVNARLEALAAAIFTHENGAPFTSFEAAGTGRNYTTFELGRWLRLP